MGLSVFGHFQKIAFTNINITQEQIAGLPAETAESYDVAIIGGGLAGLALSIQLAKLDYRIVVFEKEQYPFHKVCGEYISMESWNFLKSLGLDFKKMNVPLITQLQVSAPNGKLLTQKLPLGGFGISRYKLDHELAQIAMLAGVTIHEKTKVSDIAFSASAFSIKTMHQSYSAKVACCSYGKRSNLDIKWKRPFTLEAKKNSQNYIGVKYHIITDFPADTIALHNFDNGYCGIVKIEDDKYNLCYLATAASLRKSNGSINEMERSVLCKNPHLKKIFDETESILEGPVIISQISFTKKAQVENNILMLGDAAGMITPLCGNGMSMALHGSKLAAEQIRLFLQKRISRSEMESGYNRLWRKQFSTRLVVGRRIQSIVNNKWCLNSFLGVARRFPKFFDWLIRQTHGKPF